MQIHPFSSTILLFSPCATTGIQFAQEFLSQGFKVQLITAKESCKDQTSFQIDQLKILFIEDLAAPSVSVINNLYDCSKIYLLGGMYTSDWIFKENCDFNTVHQIGSWEAKLQEYASSYGIPLEQDTGLYCLRNVLEELINKIFKFIRGEEKRLFVNHLDFHFKLLPSSFDHENTALFKLSDGISLRDVFKIFFEEIGAEMEFCGRGINEKGVIVDFDEDSLSAVGLASPKVRLGNTLVKINESTFKVIQPFIADSTNVSNTTIMPGTAMAEIIKDMVKKALYS